MDEKRAIKIFKERLEIPDYEKRIPEYYQAMRMAVEALEKQKDNGWIPVEEKLPKDGVKVLTCDNHENIHVMRHYNFYEYPFNIGPENERYYMPKVWMQLPEPYKESEK